VGNADFTIVVLAKYDGSGAPGSVWPRVLDFSVTGASSSLVVCDEYVCGASSIAPAWPSVVCDGSDDARAAAASAAHAFELHGCSLCRAAARRPCCSGG
jgi:hypothetical protein